MWVVKDEKEEGALEHNPNESVNAKAVEEGQSHWLYGYFCGNRCMQNSIRRLQDGEAACRS